MEFLHFPLEMLSSILSANTSQLLAPDWISRELHFQFGAGRQLAISTGVTQLLLRMTLPPGQEKDLLSALRSIQLPARLERRCTRAQILQDCDEPAMISYVEDWPTPEDLEARMRSSHFSQLLALMEAVPSAPSLEFRVVSEVRGLAYVATVRAATPIPANG
jgi:quinol monooxygenase YgiN